MYYITDSCQEQLPQRRVSMNKKNNTISLRLTEEEYNIVNKNSHNLGMTTSQYFRAMIHDTLPTGVDYRQDIAPLICGIYIRLEELGLEDEEITKGVHKLCQMLS